jgi:hypothetical protein
MLMPRQDSNRTHEHEMTLIVSVHQIILIKEETHKYESIM